MSVRSNLRSTLLTLAGLSAVLAMTGCGGGGGGGKALPAIDPGGQPPSATPTTSPALSPRPSTSPQPSVAPTATPSPTLGASPAPVATAAQTTCNGHAIVNWSNGQRVPETFTQCTWQSSLPGPINRPVSANPAFAPEDGEIADYYFAGQPANDLLWADTSQAYEGRDTNFPIFVAKTTDPVVTVQCNYFGPCSLDGAKMYIPSQAKPAGASDHHLAVIQPDGVTEYDFETVTDLRPYSGTMSSPGTFKAAIGGIVKLDGSLYDGSVPPGGDGGRYPNVAPGWLNPSSPGMASGMSHTAGTLFLSELEAGQINHALALVAVCLKNVTGSWPAKIGVSSSATCPGGRGIRYGAHLWYDRPVSWIAAQGFPADVQTILIALHTYGAYIGLTGGTPACAYNTGNTGCGFDVFKFENQEPYWQYGNGTDPVAAHAASSPGWSLWRAGQYHLPNPNAALIDFQHHLHVLNDCATGTGPWPTAPSC